MYHSSKAIAAVALVIGGSLAGNVYLVAQSAPLSTLPARPPQSQPYELELLPQPLHTPMSVPPQPAPPALAADDRPLPINLPTALQLANARPWDIVIATHDVRAAAARAQGANVLWLPTAVAGTVIDHHEGPIQASDGGISTSTRTSLEVGAAPLLLYNVTDAIFEPLAARQLLRVTEANLQATTNDTVLSVAVAYFNVQQSRADLASAQDVFQKTAELVKKTEGLVPGFSPPFELNRVRAQLEKNRQLVTAARQRWRVYSAELARILRLPPDALLQPLEPPFLQVTIVPPETPVEELIAAAWATRPELAAGQASIRAALQKLREEKWRPFVPILAARGASTQTPYPLGFGLFGGGQGTSLNNFNFRSDYEVEAIWELKNLGLGNRALIRERQAGYNKAEAQLARARDFVAREVVQARADLLSAQERVVAAEAALKDSLLTADQSIQGVGTTKRVGGNIMILVVRPQEAVAAVQALLTAYTDYFSTIADYNRAQFTLYRTLGNPGQAIVELLGSIPSAPDPHCNTPPAAATQTLPPDPAPQPSIAK